MRGSREDDQTRRRRKVVSKDQGEEGKRASKKSREEIESWRDVREIERREGGAHLSALELREGGREDVELGEGRRLFLLE